MILLMDLEWRIRICNYRVPSILRLEATALMN